MRSFAPGFRTREHYRVNGPYSLLPFRFMRLDPGRQVLTNWAGQHLVVPEEIVRALVDRRLRADDPWFEDLEAAHFLTTGSSNAHVELLAAQIRTRQSTLPELAALHLFVVTLRCDHSCGYCQVSRVSADRQSFDMTEATADRAVDLMLCGPARRLKLEFQGGEPLLNFSLIRRIVARAKKCGGDRDLAFVIATNLAGLTDEILDFCAEHGVAISTSIDGPAELHDRNRPRPGRDAYARTVDGIRRCRERLGHDAVSALMTCTVESLTQPEAIIDEYVRLGFREIFLRHISPYGFAVRSSARFGYETEQFLAFYKRGLAYILSLNRRDIPMREVYTSLLFRRMLTPWPTGYVDLRSPTGAGLGALVYNYDGDVYASDEGRMLAEMGDRSFRLGNVHRNSWDDLVLETPLLDIAERTLTEGMPGCCDCAFQPWCGSDPVYHHATQGDVIGHKPTSSFCRRNMEIMRYLVQLLEDDSSSAAILRKWV